jgi:hypothetical protein
MPRTLPGGDLPCVSPLYDGAMYFDALSFLEDEREAWRPYEALAALTDEQLDTPVDAAHGWSGRDLMGHLVTYQLLSLDVAKELAVGERSPTHERADAEWEARGGEAVNEEALATWRAKSIDEVREEFARAAGELRGFLTVVPETRWVKNADQQRFFYEETIEHYDDHRAELAAILEAAGAS